MTRIRVALGICGGLMMAYAAIGTLTDPDVELGGVLLFLAAALIGHDVVLMPAIITLGAALTRLVTPPYRPAVQVTAVAGAAVAVVALPLVLGVGRAADNPSIQPLQYGKNLALILAALAGGTLLPFLLGRLASRARPVSPDRPADTETDRLT